MIEKERLGWIKFCNKNFLSVFYNSKQSVKNDQGKKLSANTTPARDCEILSHYISVTQKTYLNRRVVTKPYLCSFWTCHILFLFTASRKETRIFKTGMALVAIESNSKQAKLDRTTKTKMSVFRTERHKITSNIPNFSVQNILDDGRINKPSVEGADVPSPLLPTHHHQQKYTFHEEQTFYCN